MEHYGIVSLWINYKLFPCLTKQSECRNQFAEGVVEEGDASEFTNTFLQGDRRLAACYLLVFPIQTGQTPGCLPASRTDHVLSRLLSSDRSQSGNLAK